MVGLGVGLLLAGCGDEHVIQWRERVVTAEGGRAIGASCATLGEGEAVSTGAGAGPTDDGEPSSFPSYQLRWEGLGDGVRLSVSDVFGELVEEHTFDEAFLDSGERKTIAPAIPGGGLELVLWGGGACDAIDPADFEWQAAH